MSINDGGNNQPQSVWTFDRFKTGEHIGRSTQTIDQQTADRWHALYKSPHKEGGLPYGFVQLIVMRAYAEVVKPRPPSNIHAAYSCRLAALPSLAREIQASVDCAEKYLRGERKMVKFEVTVSDVETGNFLCIANLAICWSI